MTRQVTFKNSFTSGAWSPPLHPRVDLAQASHAASELSNVLIHAQGGVSRRPGLFFVEDVGSDGRLASFTFNRLQSYLVLWTDKRVRVYRNMTQVADIVAPWSYEQLATLCWAQGGDTMVMTHGEVAPRQLVRELDGQGRETWALHQTPITQAQGDPYHGSWGSYKQEIAKQGSYWRMPFSPHGRSDVSWRVIANNKGGRIPSILRARGWFLGSDEQVYTDTFVGSLLRYREDGKNYYFYCLQVTLQDPLGGDLSVDFAVRPVPNAQAIYPPFAKDTSLLGEMAFLDFSASRGWPRYCLFHQNRLILAGTSSRPNRVWMSHINSFWNFSEGEALDDEAITLDISEKTVDPVREVFSGRDLQVFTDDAEWVVSGRPLTPEAVQVRRETTHGLYPHRRVRPQLVEGATLFVDYSGRVLRELYYNTDADAYVSGDLSVLAQEVLGEPLEQVYDDERHIVYVPCEAGHVAALTVYRGHQVLGWSRLTTEGRFRSVALVGGRTFFLVEREHNGAKRFCLECFKDDLHVDSALEFSLGEMQEATRVWTHPSLTRLIDDTRAFVVVGDGEEQQGVRVQDAQSLRLRKATRDLTVGLSYTHCIAPLPFAVQSGAYRPIETVFRLHRSGALQVDYGRGVRDVPLQKMMRGRAMSDAPFSGEVALRSDGWRKREELLWRIEQKSPQPFHLLSIKTQIKVVE
ncbi:MAG: hypothetical protein GDA50_02490 [Alphaproteobacteria bacterium GM202ARS2]|nr:hypothetical protein [Alphaproteobacteria bacterium GM202ARS2]